MKRYAGNLFLIFSMLFLSYALAGAAPADNKTAVYPPAMIRTSTVKTAVSASEIKLRSSLRNLFTQCLNKQRSLTVKILTGAQDSQTAQDKLTASVNKIGDVFKAYYGDSTGSQITALFAQYIQAAADYANAVNKGGDKAGIISGMHGKAGDIANLFNSFNTSWSKSGLSDALNRYCALSVKEIDMEHISLGKPDEKIFMATFRQSAEIGEILAEGIANQFPDKFKQ